MTTDRIIHIVDDEAQVRASLAFMLMSSGYAVRTHESGPAFLAALTNAAGACLITDLRMPDMNGVELVQALAERGFDLPSIIITGHGDVPMAVAAMKAGATDFIEKPFSNELIVDAIQRACDLVNPKPSGKDAAAIYDRLALLTSREREILTGIVAGLPNKTVAYDLKISPRTVEVHRASIMSKMQARNLPELVRMTMSVDPAKMSDPN
jgi:two-component system response regulator FixJ